MKKMDGNKYIALYLGYEYFSKKDPRLQGKYPPGWKLHPESGSRGDEYLCRWNEGLSFHKSEELLQMAITRMKTEGFFKVGTRPLPDYASPFRFSAYIVDTKRFSVLGGRFNYRFLTEAKFLHHAVWGCISQFAKWRVENPVYA